MIPLYKVFVPDNINDGIEEILKSGQLTSGLNAKIFEKQIQEFIGNPYVMVTGSNTFATLIALSLCGLKNNDEVIASPMSCLASNQPVLNFGAKLIWADIDPNTGTLDPKDVKKKITSKTKAILHYHWGGYPGYIDEINYIGNQFGIPVIDDAIESFGSEYKGLKLGNTDTFFTTFSFQTVRLPNSIDGGAIAFRDRATYEKAIRMRDFGIDRATFRDNLGEISSKSDICYYGYNAIINELNAFIGRKVMEKTPALIDVQRKNILYWNNFCTESGYVSLNTRKEILPNYWIYSFLTPSQDIDIIRIRKKGYYASKVHIRNDQYSCFGYFDESLIGVNEFSKKQLSVPSGWWFKTYK